jgi:hypothetical protein
MEKYTFEEHIHRYAVWTAARAVNRDFAKTEVIRKAIEKSGMLKAYLDNPLTDSQEYESWHGKCATSLVRSFKSVGIECAFGRAAKIIAIYLKTAVILPNRGRGSVCKAIFPPIDSILLKALLSDPEILKKLKREDKELIRDVTWTKLDKSGYTKLKRAISCYASFDWTLEIYWQPSDKAGKSLK